MNSNSNVGNKEKKSNKNQMATRKMTKEEKNMNEDCEHEDSNVANNLVSLEHDNIHAFVSEDVNSQVSICESLPNNLYTVRLKLAKAQLLKKKLEEKLDLERKLKVIEVEQEIELAELECALLEENDYGCTPPKFVGKENRVDSVSRNNEGSYITQPMNTNAKVDISSFVNPVTTMSNYHGLPKLEMSYFEGQPKFYWGFIRQFDSIVSSKVADNGQLLSYLLHYCKGKARLAIEACVVLPVDEGYKQARKILHDLFGQEHMVARSYIDELVRSNKTVNNSADELTDFAIKLRSGYMTLSQMGYIADLNSPINLECIVSRLPIEIQSKWVETADKVLTTGREPEFKDLMEFVEGSARIARTRYGVLLRANKNARETKQTNMFGGPPRRSYVNATNSNENYSVMPSQGYQRICRVCKKQHNISECKEFLNMSISDRRDRVKHFGVCYLCLKSGHIARDCTSRLKCDVDSCQVRHHPLLHVHTVGSNPERKAVVHHTLDSPRPNVYFGVVPVRLFGLRGIMETYAFLDSGSDTSLVTDELVERLGLDGEPSVLNMTTLNGTSSRSCKIVELEPFALDGSSSVKIPKAYTISSLPIGSVGVPDVKELNRWKHLKSINFPCLQDKTVSILIGCDAPDAHWVLEQRLGNRKHPFAMRTHLGWMVMGPTDNIGHSRENCCCSLQCEVVDSYDKLYNHEFNDLDSFNKELSIEDKRALEIANNSVKFTNGHFEVGLPWKYAKPTLPDNLVMATRRLECLKKRLLKDIDLLKRYKKVMDDHLSKGYIVKVDHNYLSNENALKWYIPHHPVLNPKKPDKLRVVFDCRACYHGTSLNQQLLQGPNTVNNLAGVLLRFRRERVAVAADIEEMFLQVKIPTTDRGAFRLLWWDDGDIQGTPKEFQLTVHPFGAASSPFCANFALRKTIREFSTDKMSLVDNVVDDYFYVDDCLISVNGEVKAIEVVEYLTAVLRRGGFRLTKWISNSPKVLSSISQEERASAVKEINLEKVNVERTLGLYWDTTQDAFVYIANLPTKPITRRGILSCVASLYDPLGLVAPFILPAKQLLQRLCNTGLGWDENIPEDEGRRWYRWLDTVRKLSELSFPRCLGIIEGAVVGLQLHFFCDASEAGYGIVAYIRLQTPDSQVKCSLVMAKARVAPLKVQTIPRLELTAATLAARTSEMLQAELRQDFEKVFYWTDSSVVLYYINNTNERYRTFVANRLSIIHRITRIDQWRHVPSEYNVADWASRGLERVDDRTEIWVNGPRFLLGPEDSWPQLISSSEIGHQNLEFKKTAVVNVLIKTSGIYKLIEYFSNWMRLLKAISWIRRFVAFTKIKFGGRTDITIQLGPIKVFEMDIANEVIINNIQATEFPLELKALSNGNLCRLKDKNSRLRKLNPILINGLLRVGGRLQNSQQMEETKHPLILPSRHHITDLIIRHYHVREGHIGATQLLATLRERFWILKGGAAVKRVISKCIQCKRVNPRLGCQIMAPLPSVRVNVGDHPFEYVGVDYFGPILVKRGRTMEKRYGCLFTCLKIRAVHLEIAHSLSTDSFIMALMRFIGRRGFPKEIYSDNGSNLVGAKNELKDCLRDWSQERIHDCMLRYDIQWNFIPPAASHWGGVWERMVRSVKKVLSALSNEQTLSDECLLTFIIEVERIINNRPLTPQNSDPNDLQPITPAKLILLRDNTVTLGGTSQSNQYIRRWRKANYLADVFWKRWVKEYISTLQHRQKWLHEGRNFTTGDLVIVVSDIRAKSKWPLGLVSKVFSGSDGLVRQVEVKTANGYLIRDIRKLCLLEAFEESKL